MIWGLTSGGWMSGLLPQGDERHESQLKLLASHGLQATGWRLDELMAMEPVRRQELAALARELDVRVGLAFGFDYLSDDPAEMRERTRAIIRGIQTLAPLFRSPVCVSGIRRYSSFDRDVPVAEQIERLSPVLAPLAAAAHEHGCPLGLHNAAHYCSDLAQLCQRTPHLGILFDTANPFLVGERPLRAARAAAPYTVGTHIKDHYVWPDKAARPLCLRVRGAVVGEGDVGMEEVCDVLMRGAPNPARMPMLLEIDPVQGMDQAKALERSLEFAQGLKDRYTRVQVTG